LSLPEKSFQIVRPAYPSTSGPSSNGRVGPELSSHDSMAAHNFFLSAQFLNFVF
jgi:hypothetical protein